MSADLEYAIHKAVRFVKANGEGELQYTLGPVYAPMQRDAHDEYITDDVLHKAMLDYSVSGDRNLRLQHNPNVVSGQWVELMRLPAEMTAPVTKADGTSTDVTFPKGTILMGVIWSDAAWPLVKAGKIGGLSMGGRAMRVKGTLEDTAKDGNGVPAMGYAKVGSPGSAPNQGAMAMAAAGATPGIAADGNADTQPTNSPLADDPHMKPSFAGLTATRDRLRRHPLTGRILPERNTVSGPPVLKAGVFGSIWAAQVGTGS